MTHAADPYRCPHNRGIMERCDPCDLREDKAERWRTVRTVALVIAIVCTVLLGMAYLFVKVVA
jgi:hypothetical protein